MGSLGNGFTRGLLVCKQKQTRQRSVHSRLPLHIERPPPLPEPRASSCQTRLHPALKRVHYCSKCPMELYISHKPRGVGQTGVGTGDTCTAPAPSKVCASHSRCVYWGTILTYPHKLNRIWVNFHSCNHVEGAKLSH